MKRLAPFIVMAGIVLTGCTSRTYDDIEPLDEELGLNLLCIQMLRGLSMTPVSIAIQVRHKMGLLCH